MDTPVHFYQPTFRSAPVAGTFRGGSGLNEQLAAEEVSTGAWVGTDARDHHRVYRWLR